MGVGPSRGVGFRRGAHSSASAVRRLRLRWVVGVLVVVVVVVDAAAVVVGGAAVVVRRRNGRQRTKHLLLQVLVQLLQHVDLLKVLHLRITQLTSLPPAIPTYPLLPPNTYFFLLAFYTYQNSRPKSNEFIFFWN